MNGINFKEEYEFPNLKAPYNHCIYVHINKINGKVYVGQTTNPKERWSRQGSRYKDSPKFYGAITKYGWDNFSHIIIESDLTEEQANEREVFWIAQFNSTQDSSGYNMTPGGNNYMQALWQDESFRQKMSEVFSKRSKEQWKDKEFGKAAQAKMQEGVQRFWGDPEKRSKRIEDLKGDKNPNSKAVMNLETGMVFSTIKEATEWAGLKAVSCIGANCRGERKSAGKHPITGEKLHWCYVTGGD